MDDDEITAAARILDAMANPRRLAVLAILEHEGEMSVNSLVAQVGISQSALSQYLAKLKTAGAVNSRREGQTIYYSPKSLTVRLIIERLESASRDSDDGNSSIDGLKQKK